MNRTATVPPFSPALRKSALLLLVFLSGALSPVTARDRTEIIYAFRNFRKPQPQRMILVGEIRSKIKAAEIRDVRSPFMGYDTRQDQVTVKVMNRRGLKVGQKLFVIDKNPYHKKYRNGMVVGEIVVRSIFAHPFYGWVLTGTGILLRVRIGMFVARTMESEKLERAYEKKKRGDYFYERGEADRAIASYHSALESDRSLPEAHWALGRLYLETAREGKKEMPVRSLAEFKQAWRHRDNFQYRFDEYSFYIDYMEALFLAFDFNRNRVGLEKGAADPVSIDNLKTVIEVGERARELNAKGPRAFTYLARAHYYRMEYAAGRRGREYEKLFEESRDKAAEYLQRGIALALTAPDGHRTAFLYYFALYEDIRRDPKLSALKYRRLEKLIRYSPDFIRWEDVTYNRPAEGVARLRRLLHYHAEKYNRYRQPALRPDPEFQDRFRRI